MPFSRWLRRSARPIRTARPVVTPLEDRTVPTVLGWFGHQPPGPATHLQVIVPENVQAGQTFTAEVEALDASNHVATSFADAVQLSSGDATAVEPQQSGSPLKLPQPVTLQHGIAFVQVQLSTVGPETLTATDQAANTTVTSGSGTTNVNPAPVLTKVNVVTPETAATGVLTPVTVQALDQSGHLLRNFTGTVTLTSSDSAATASATHNGTQTSLSGTTPFTYTFTSSDHGQHTFWVKFGTGTAAGTATTLTASTPSGNTALSGSGNVTVYPPTTVTHLGLFALPFAIAGQATPVEVVALNASDQPVSGYTGTVSFSLGTADANATISATHNGTTSSLASFSYPFTAADAGKHTFWLTLSATGSQKVTVTDGTLTASETVQVVNLPHRG